MAATMQAIRIHQFGGPEVLQLDTVPRPEPGEGELLVKVHAAGVLPMETAVRRGEFQRPLPHIPGTAFAGVVEKIGAGMTNFKIGDAICGRSPSGTYAEYTTMAANPPAPDPHAPLYTQSARIIPLAHKPDKLSFDEAATLSGGATTAWTSIFDDGGVSAGQRVLIHGGAGGVGLFAVQFAKWKGAHVTATASTSNVDFVRSLGADEVIDYTTTRFEDVAHDMDFVLDTMGGEVMNRSMPVVKRGGALISIYGEPSAEQATALGIRATHNQTTPQSEHLRKVIEVIAAGHARPVIRQPFALKDAPQAHALSESGHGRGRIVLHIAD